MNFLFVYIEKRPLEKKNFSSFLENSKLSLKSPSQFQTQNDAPPNRFPAAQFSGSMLQTNQTESISPRRFRIPPPVVVAIREVSE